MKKIITARLLLSFAVVVVAAATIFGATYAFLSDTETSTGNTLAAGDLDLGIDNHSYYNGVLNPGTTWEVQYDLTNPPRQFFNFTDVKPGDWGEDTISLHSKTNDAWVCADVKLTSNDDNGINEPESVDGDTTDGPGNGELANAINFFWWADDGDNVYEQGETLLPAGPMGNLSVGQTATVALADSTTNIWGTPGPLPGDTVKFLAKAWCFGNTTMTPYPQGTTGPDVRPVICDGSTLDNKTQTDSFTADITFRAIQSRDNPDFTCIEREATPTPTPTPSVTPEPSEPFVDSVTAVNGTYGHCCDVNDLASDTGTATPLITGPNDANFIQISGGSSITARFDNNKAVDAPGNDIRIWTFDTLFPADANVEISADPACLTGFSDPVVRSDTVNGEIDLATLTPPLTEARCVKITDLNGPDHTFPTLGFDLDAIEAIHSVVFP